MKWYHVTSVNRGISYAFLPFLPCRVQKGEDRRTPRICVTNNWRHSLRSIMMIHLDRYFYVYSSTETPINPQVYRQGAIERKEIRSSSNNFKLPSDGIVNKEHWYLSPQIMKLEGHIRIQEEDYVAALIGLGMFNYPDPEKMRLLPGKPSFDTAKTRSGHEVTYHL